MTNMEWFLISQNEHLGPFTQEVLEHLFQSGEIDKESLVWKEGWEEAKTFEEAFLLSADDMEFQPISDGLESVYDSEPQANIIKDEDLPPDLPPGVGKVAAPVVEEDGPPSLPGQRVAPEPVQKPQERKRVPVKRGDDKKHDDEYDGQKVEQLSEESLNKSSMEEFEDEVDVEDVFEYDFDISSQEKRLHKIIRGIIVAVSTLIVLVPIIVYFTEDAEIFERPRSMSLSDFERLQNTAKIDSQDLKFEFSLATDKRTLWISTNLPLEGEIFVSLKSKAARTLGGLVEVKAKGDLSKRLITLSEFQYVQGTRFVDGYYDAELYTVKDLEEPFFNKFFEPREKQFRYLNDVLITSLHPAEFKKILKKKNAKKNDNQQKFWEELREEYKTVKSITEGIKSALLVVFDGDSGKWEENLSLFERKYKSNYGIFFTTFVQSVESKYEFLNKKDFPDKTKIISHYTNLKEIAKEIGAQSVGVLENLKSTNVSSMTRADYQDLKHQSLIKFNLIINECDEMIEKL